MIRNIFIKILKKIIKLIEPKQKKISDNGPGYSVLFGKKFYYQYKPAFDITFHEIFEKGVYTFIPKNLNPTIIDCGANMGLSLLFFSMSYPTAKIYAFEPDHSVLEVLKKNLQTYKMKNVELYEKAVWSKNEILNFYTDGGMGGRLENIYNNQVPIQVETIRLKDFIGDKHIDLLKMDIEGAEFEVISDCESKLSQIDNIFIEYHSMENETQKLDDLLFILKNNGFRYHLSQSFSRNKPFVEKTLVCEKIDLAINIFGYRIIV